MASWDFVPPFDFAAQFLASRARRRGEQVLLSTSQNLQFPIWWSNYIICSHLFPKESRGMNAPPPLAPLAAKQENTLSIFQEGRAQNQIISGEYFLAWLCPLRVRRRGYTDIQARRKGFKGGIPPRLDLQNCIYLAELSNLIHEVQRYPYRIGL